VVEDMVDSGTLSVVGTDGLRSTFRIRKMSPKTSLRAFEVNAMMQITLNFDKGDVTPVFQQLQQIQVKLQCTGQVDHTGYLTRRSV
jgi:hypothetical protein